MTFFLRCISFGSAALALLATLAIAQTAKTSQNPAVDNFQGLTGDRPVPEIYFFEAFAVRFGSVFAKSAVSPECRFLIQLLPVVGSAGP